MTSGDERRTLTDDQITSRFVLTGDVVRQAVDQARDLAARANRTGAPDELVPIPAAEFQSLLESLGTMHKTLLTSINARVQAVTGPRVAGGPELADEPADRAAATAAMSMSVGMLKAQNGAAMAEAKLIVDSVGRNVPSEVQLPAHTARLISDSVLLTESMLAPAVFSEEETSGTETCVYDRGDLGFCKNWYNTGDFGDRL